jgi:mono/diheme cytochrome c family protein
MLRKLAAAIVLLAAIGGLAFWFLTAPVRLDTATVGAAPAGDAARGEMVFWAGGCTSCHAAPGSTGEARLQLVGGVELASPFGTFVAPNISQHPDGIGGWSFEDFANAMMRGVSPDGRHYFPAFPYTSYARMEIADIADLFAFMQTLPPVAGKAPPHKVGFPFNVRRGVGAWKLLYFTDEPVVAMADTGPAARGRYLAEGPGHCGECHTPRNSIGGPDKSRWLGGAPNPAGQGTIPNITSASQDVGSWTEADIANFLETGFTPEFDSAGGQMAEVVKNLAELPADDRTAIAAYLKAIPAVAD